MFVLGKLFPAAWNVFKIYVISLKHGFVKITFLISLINFHPCSTDDFILAWCLFPCKARSCTIFTVQCSCTFLPLNLPFPQKLQRNSRLPTFLFLFCIFNNFLKTTLSTVLLKSCYEVKISVCQL